MANIKAIHLRLKTGTSSGASTDGDVFLGIGGREFGVDSAADDFGAGSDRTYIMGEGAGEGSTIVGVDVNDPRSPYQLKTKNLNKFPAYLRFEPKSQTDNWQVEEVKVTVNPGPGQVVLQAMPGGDKLWLGRRMGKQVFLLPA